MKKIIVSIFILLPLLLQAGCSRGCGGGAEKPPLIHEAKYYLVKAGVDPATLQENDGNLSIAFEASKAAQYDDQIFAEWGTIFGVLGWYAKETVTIINTADGQPVFMVIARSEDIISFISGKIESGEFMKRLEIDIPGE